MLDREQGQLQAAQQKAQAFNDAGDLQMAKAEVEMRFNSAAAAYLKSVRDYEALQKASVQTLQKRFDGERQATLVAAGGLIALLLAAGVAGASLLIRAIRKPIDQAVRVARRIADGDLTTTIEIDRDDEFAELLRSLRHMVQSLSSLVGNVRATTDSIAAASAEVASGSLDLSSRTEEAASSLQQTAGSLEQLTGNVRRSADVAR